MLTKNEIKFPKIREVDFIVRYRGRGEVLLIIKKLNDIEMKIFLKQFKIVNSELLVKANIIWT